MKKLLLLLILFASPVLANTHYVATTGTDSGDCTVSACLTIGYGIDQLASGDTLEIADGTYTGSDNKIDNDVPNGATISTGVPGAGAGATTIKAENDFGVTIDSENTYQTSGMTLSSRHNILIQGIRFVRGSNTGISIGGGEDLTASYITVSKCAIHSYAYNLYGINIRVSAHSNNYDDVAYQPHHILFVDSHSWGDGRYGGYIHYARDIIFRRVVFRGDEGSKLGEDPISGLAFYNAWDSRAENVLVIDQNENSCLTSCEKSGIYITEHHSAMSNIQVYGSILVNIHGQIIQADSGDTITGTNWVRQTVAWNKDTNGQYNVYLKSTFNGSVSNSTIGHNYMNTHSSGYSGGISASGMEVDHTIVSNEYAWGIRELDTASNNNNVYNVCQDSNGKACDAYGTATDPGIESDPLLKYLPDASITTAGGVTGSGSPPTDDDGSGDSELIGAVVLKRYENGSLTDTDLWPWETEDQIKDDFVQYAIGGTDPDRGFCATGNQLDGETEITLTSYIWEYLGNEIPSYIYDAVADPDPDSKFEQTGVTGFEQTGTTEFTQ